LSGAGFSPNFHSRATSETAEEKYPSNFRLFETAAPIAAFDRYVHLALHQKLAPACGRPALD
jgi:hypothetical protein